MNIRRRRKGEGREGKGMRREIDDDRGGIGMVVLSSLTHSRMIFTPLCYPNCAYFQVQKLSSHGAIGRQLNRSVAPRCSSLSLMISFPHFLMS